MQLTVLTRLTSIASAKINLPRIRRALRSHLRKQHSVVFIDATVSSRIITALREAVIMEAAEAELAGAMKDEE